MPWDSIDKWRDEDYYPPRGIRKRNPLEGICIHGINGAIMKRGTLVSPDCEECTRMLALTHQ